MTPNLTQSNKQEITQKLQHAADVYLTHHVIGPDSTVRYWCGAKVTGRCVSKCRRELWSTTMARTYTLIICRSLHYKPPPFFPFLVCGRECCVLVGRDI